MGGRHERLSEAPKPLHRGRIASLLLSASIVIVSSAFVATLVLSRTGVDPADARAVQARHDTLVLIDDASMQLALAQKCPGTRTRSDIVRHVRELARFSDGLRVDFDWETDSRIGLSISIPRLNYEAHATATPSSLGTIQVPLDEFCTVTM